jgi:hypothetical protein
MASHPSHLRYDIPFPPRRTGIYLHNTGKG